MDVGLKAGDECSGIWWDGTTATTGNHNCHRTHKSQNSIFGSVSTQPELKIILS